MFAFFSQIRSVKLGEILMYSHGRGEVEPREGRHWLTWGFPSS